MSDPPRPSRTVSPAWLEAMNPCVRRTPEWLDRRFCRAWSEPKSHPADR